jgi:hypothetical protein
VQELLGPRYRFSLLVVSTRSKINFRAMESQMHPSLKVDLIETKR